MEMPGSLDFDLFIQYTQRFGATFSSFDLSDPEILEKAHAQMRACLAGDRDEPVTDDSIGLLQGEGDYSDEIDI